MRIITITYRKRESTKKNTIGFKPGGPQRKDCIVKLQTSAYSGPPVIGPSIPVNKKYIRL